MELQVSIPDPQAVQNQHCWECRRRQLVCDSTRPVCKRCQLSKIVCPGYDEKQLRWLAPGRVTCRTRKSKSTAKSKATGDAGKRPDSDDSYGKLDQDQVRLITDFEMRTETSTIVKAAYYYITWAYQTVSPLHRIAENCEQKPFPLAMIHYFPTSLRYGFVSIAMTHRLYQLPEGTPRDFLVEAKSRNYQYRGMALRALNEEIASEERGASPALIASAITMLCVDLSLFTVAEWRHHFNAVVAMMKLLGGLKTVHRTMPFMRLPLVTIIVHETFGNTTSPYCDQLDTFTNSGMMDEISEIYGDGVLPLYSGTLCPRQLLLNVLSINELRQQAANPAAKPGTGQPAAGDLLEQIHDFSPADWIKGKATANSKREWLLIGSTYQSAVALYCIMSLQSLSILPSALYITAMDAAHYERLMQLLKQALTFPHLRHCLLWPLIVAGVRAVYGSADDRKFVDDQFKELSRVGGTALPLTASAALKQFWASGKTCWDDCFDKPYIFAA